MMINQRTTVGLMTEFPDFSVKGFDIDRYNQRFCDANVIIDACARNISYPPHWGCLSIKFCFHGNEMYRANNGLYSVDPENYLVLNEGKYYSSWIDSKVDVHSFTINFTPNFQKEVISSVLLSAMPHLDDPTERLDHDFQFVERLYSNNPRISKRIVYIRKLAGKSENQNEKLNTQLAGLLTDLIVSQQSVQEEIESLQKMKSSTRKELFGRLTRAKDFIYSSYQHEIGLNEMADVACLNQYYFLRQFTKAFQVTPHQFLTQRRLAHASRLLKETDHPISEVCREVGFEDPASFSKLFKKKFGYSPLEFRKL
jgi:AraC family transcriptional regulator